MSEILTETLANGLTIIGESNPAHRSAAVGFFVRTGARDETSAEAGISHFLEHMMFKGTAKRSAMQLTYDLGNIAAQSNAYTTEESTVYYAVVLPEYFGQATEILCDMLRPTLTQEEFDTEKKVILEEIALYLDKPAYFLFERAFADYFSGHTAGQSVLGSTESVGAITSAQMRDYFGRRYVPKNMAVIATGNYDWRGFIREVERFCGSWEGGEAKRIVRPHQPVSTKKLYSKANIEQAHVALISAGPSASEHDRYAAGLLAMIIGDHSGSRLYWELVDKGIAESASFESDEKEGTGIFLSYLSCAPSEINRVIDTARGIISTAADFSEQDLSRAKRKLLSRIVMSGELPMGRFSSVGTQWQYHESIAPLREISKRYESVQKKDILEMLERYPLSTVCEYRLLPE